MRIQNDGDDFQESKFKAARACMQMLTQFKSKTRQTKRSGICLCQV
jgi:hypothetical protein